MVLTLGRVAPMWLGLLVNASRSPRIVHEVGLLPVATFRARVDMPVLLVVVTVAVSLPALRAEERFALNEACRIVAQTFDEAGEVLDQSLTGAMERFEEDLPHDLPGLGDRVMVEVADVGRIPAEVRRLGPPPAGKAVRGQAGLGTTLGVRFCPPASDRRGVLIRKLFTRGLRDERSVPGGLTLAAGILARAFRKERLMVRLPEAALEPPRWVLDPPAAEERRVA